MNGLQSKQSSLRGYGLALAAVCVATLARVSLIPVLGYRYGFATFLLSTFVSGRYAGFGPSLLALFLGAVPPAAMHFVPPNQTFNTPFQVAMGVYFFLGGIVVALCNSEYRTRARLHKEIADREEIESELRSSRQQLLLAIEAAQLGTWELDLRTHRVRWSDLMEPMHGYEPGTFGGTLEDAIAHNHPEDRDQIMQKVDDKVGPNRKTYRVVLPGGKVRWIEGIGHTVPDERGQAARMYGVCLDITEQKEADLAVRQAEEKFRLLAVHAPVGIFQLDSELRYVFVNPKWCEIYGIDARQVLGISRHADFVHPDDLQACSEAWQAAGGKADRFCAEFRVLHRDGRIRWVVTTITELRDSAGAVTGYVGTLFDVTERKTAEDTIRASEARLKGILDNTTSIVYLKDLDGRYLMTNRQWEKLFGLTSEQAAGRSSSELFSRELSEQFKSTDRKVVESGEPVQVEEVIPFADGQHAYVTVNFPIKDSNGTVIAIGGMATDMTEQRKTLEALAAEQEMLRHTIELQDRERELLAYEIHDGLVQYAAGALMQIEGLSENVAREKTGTEIDDIAVVLRRAVAEGRRLINGIRTPVLNDWGIVAAVEQLIDEEDRAHVQVEFVKDENIGRMSPAIEEALYRITQEAMTNVRKHSQSSQVRVQLGLQDNKIHLEIRDWGVGFTDGDRSRNVHGLRVMTERARIAGGQCTIESEPGRGTRVAVELPYLTRPEPEAAAGCKS